MPLEPPVRPKSQCQRRAGAAPCGPRRISSCGVNQPGSRGGTPHGSCEDEWGSERGGGGGRANGSATTMLNNYLRRIGVRRLRARLHPGRAAASSNAARRRQ
eukprot:365858-Chlamydomonas_euryale.AAC.8